MIGADVVLNAGKPTAGYPSSPGCLNQYRIILCSRNQSHYLTKTSQQFLLDTRNYLLTGLLCLGKCEGIDHYIKISTYSMISQALFPTR